MRLSTRVAALCVGRFVSHQAAATELPPRRGSVLGESKLVGFYPGTIDQ